MSRRFQNCCLKYIGGETLIWMFLVAKGVCEVKQPAVSAVQGVVGIGTWSN